MRFRRRRSFGRRRVRRFGRAVRGRRRVSLRRSRPLRIGYRM